MPTADRKILRRVLELAIFQRNFLADALFSLAPKRKKPAAGTVSVLLVRLDSIGDFVLWQDSLQELRRLYPPDRFRFTLLANALWADLARELPFFDEVIPLERKALHYDLGYRLRLWCRLRGTFWDEVIQPTHSREFLFGDAAVRVCSAPLRTGSAGDLANQSAFCRRISDRWYTRLIPAGDGEEMELLRNARLLRGLGAAGFQAGMPELALKERLPRGFSAREYALFVPGAGSVQRQWPVERFAELAWRVRKTRGLATVICGSAAEAHLGSSLLRMLEGQAEDWTGRTSLAELVAIIKGARVVIGNDSSAIHIAAALGVPAFCSMGGGQYGRFLPYRLERPSSRPLPVPLRREMECFGCGWHCCAHQDAEGGCAPCLERVQVSEVWEAIDAAFQDGDRR
ncbi:MAG: hypothetical protein A2075_15705 [Geobacteraceae bacterium GWC2_58_44]|nr:MAG: hypothetical protein A2075_15705 [Geobacteraceae bacterium GWC2_58_44]HBG06030.1 glycosyl transferase [Geobacter sp.]